MERHLFRYHTGNGQWQTGSCVYQWEAYVTRFFRQFPNGELDWISSSCS